MANKIQIRRGTAAEWTSANPTLSSGEIGFETDTYKLKIGNGVDDWASLSYYSSTEALPIAQKTGTTLVFTEDAFYNEATPLTSGNITYNTTGAVIGATTLNYVDKYVPTQISSSIDLIQSGDFDATKFHEVLTIYDGTRFNSWVTQFTYLDSPSPTVLAGDTQIVFNDFGVTGATNYEILFSTTNDINTASVVPGYNGIDTDYTHSSLNNGTTYYYWFKCSGIKYLDSVYQAENGTPTSAAAWDLASFGYNSKSLDVSALGNQPLGLFFKPDGTRLFVIENVGGDITSYNMSTAWDITTAVAGSTQSIGISTTETGLWFKGDGTKVFFIAQSTSALAEATLSTAWDISTMGTVTLGTASLLQSTSVSLYFKSDGTEVFVANKTNGTIHSFIMSTAWDITTAVAGSTFDASGQDTGFHQIFFKPDGTKMYIGGETNDILYQYTLSTAWDLTSAIYDTVTLDTSSEDADMRDCFFKPDGLLMWSLGITNDTLYEYIAT